MSSTTKLITPLFMKNLNLSNTILFFGNNRSNRRDIIKKTVPKVMVRISNRYAGLENLVIFTRY